CICSVKRCAMTRGEDEIVPDKSTGASAGVRQDFYDANLRCSPRACGRAVDDGGGGISRAFGDFAWSAAAGRQSDKRRQRNRAIRCGWRHFCLWRKVHSVWALSVKGGGVGIGTLAEIQRQGTAGPEVGFATRTCDVAANGRVFESRCWALECEERQSGCG